MVSSGKRSSSRRRLFSSLSATPHGMAPWYGVPTHTTLCNLLAAFIGGQILLTAVFILRSAPPCDCRCQWRPDMELDGGKYGRSLETASARAQIAKRMDTDERGGYFKQDLRVNEANELHDPYLSKAKEMISAEMNTSNINTKPTELVRDNQQGENNTRIIVKDDVVPTKHVAIESVITSRPIHHSENEKKSLADLEREAEVNPNKQAINIKIDTAKREPGESSPQVLPAPFTILTTTNTAFSDLTENWLESIRRLGVPFNITLIAEDSGAFVHFMSRKSRLESSGLVKITLKYTDKNASRPNALGFYTKDYIQLVGKRPHYILDILSQGSSVLFADADAVWLKNPIPLIAKSYNNYDVWVALGEGGKIPCPCFMFIKPTPRAIAMVKTWQERIDEQLESARPENDQVSLATVMHNHVKYRRLKVRRLDMTAFPTGQSMFLTKGWYAAHKDEIYVVHANKVGGHAKKKFVLKWKKLWYLGKNS